MDLTHFLAFLGLVSVVRTSARLLRWLHIYFLRPSKALHRYGSWALVTGATDGIGKAFAFQLARHGLNLILVSRRADKLESVAKEIKDRDQVEIKTVALDFTEDDMMAEGARRIEEAIEGVDVGVLVNNAGAAYRRAAFFDEVEERRWRDVVRVNVEGTSWVSRVVMKGMAERGRGAVVNIGSGASCVLPSFPLSSVYSATKAYVDQFSRCLYVEYKNKGIDVQCQVPLYVATKMVSIRRSSFFVPSSDTYARAALRWIGYEPRCTPYWPHSVLWCLISMLPESAVDNWHLGSCLNMRKKGQLKDAMKKEQ